MTVEEQRRRHMQEALVNTLGTDPADTLMHDLPPIGWADVATKRDVDALQQVLHLQWRSDLVEVRADVNERCAHVETTLHQELRGLTFRLIGVFIVLQTASIAAMKLI